ncbi:MAG: hypothetical protein AAGK00_05990 [Pseudomonadota bacterium]
MKDADVAKHAHRDNAWQGLMWPILSLGGGMVAYFLLFGLLVDPLSPTGAALHPNSYAFLWEAEPAPAPHQVLAADLNARYGIAIPSVLLTIAFLATIAMAFVKVLPLFGKPATASGAVALLVGAFIGYLEQYNNATRAHVANCNPASGTAACPLNQAAQRSDGQALASFDQAALDQILLLVHWNSMVSVAAIVLLGMCFLFIAREAAEDELTPDILYQRKTAFLVSVVVAGLVLVFSVATANGFYRMAAALMSPADAAPMFALAEAGASYWGAVYSTVIIVISAPAAMAVLADIRRGAALACPGTEYAQRRDWREDHGLNVNFRQVLAPLLASLSPLLTTPALNVLSPALLGD